MDTIEPRLRSAVGIAWATAVPVLALLVYDLPSFPVLNREVSHAAVYFRGAEIPSQATSDYLVRTLGGTPFGDVLASADASLIHYIRVTT